MKKLFLSCFLFAAILTSCNLTITDLNKIHPIEKYKGCVITKIEDRGGEKSDFMDISLKTKDTLFTAIVIRYDIEQNKYKVSDTIK